MIPELGKEYHIVDTWDEFSCKGKFIDVLLKDKLPNPDLIIKYYGEYAPETVFREMKVDRLVFIRIDLKDTNQNPYVIIPDNHRWDYFTIKDT